MSQTIEAIYKNGVFRPITPVAPEFCDGETVCIQVTESSTEQQRGNPIMKLAENFYEGLSEKDIDEIESIALDRVNFRKDGTP